MKYQQIKTFAIAANMLNLAANAWKNYPGDNCCNLYAGTNYTEFESKQCIPEGETKHEYIANTGIQSMQCGKDVAFNYD